jgi:hypothetical protein
MCFTCLYWNTTVATGQHWQAVCRCYTRGTRAVTASAHSSDGHSDISGPLLLWGTCTGATSAHSSDEPFDISGSLLLPPTIATRDMTSDDCYYCWARDMHAGAPSAHNSDRPSDTSRPLLLPPTVATCDMTKIIILYAPNYILYVIYYE